MTLKKKKLLVRVLPVLVMLALILALNAHTSDAATTALTATGQVNSSNGAFVRAKPTKNSKKVTGLSNNKKVTITGEVFVTPNKTGAIYKWYHITVGKKTGYIRSDLVDNIKYTKTSPAETTGNVNYRKGAGVSMPKVGMFKKGKSLTVVMEAKSSNNTKWYKVKYGTKYYYSSAKYTKLTTKKTTVVTTIVEAIVGTGTEEASEVVQSKAAAKVAANSAAWARKIANDNSFHYGNGLHSHHNGCYFCGTQPSSKKKYVVQWQKTYCCNPFVTAAYAHGGNEPFMLSLCSRGKSYMAPEFKKCDRFANLGHPDQSELKVGDILCATAHVAIYLGNNKIAEACMSDDGIPGSSKWNNSIKISSLTSSRYKGFKAGVFRYVGPPAE